MPSLARAGLHQRKGYQPPLFALAIEAEWRKRALGVVPAQPKARPEGQRHRLIVTEPDLIPGFPIHLRAERERSGYFQSLLWAEVSSNPL